MNKMMLILSVLLVGCSSREEPRKPVSRASGSFLKQSIEIGVEQKEGEEKIFDSIIKANPDKEYHLSQKGYWYTFIEKNESEDYYPKAGDLVYFESEVLSVVGDTIYKFGDLSEREYMVDKEDIIIGLRDGIKRMKKAEKVQFLLPSHIAYGYVGDKNRIGMNVPLLYTVKVNDIKKKEDRTN
ncbi:MAG: gliding motility-associated peptidyl-prolyl isomerase GldI [Bacteroidota bacterium]|nr:gliding motility-associated peptidyl-prolyl isomerase GldI [Bacteroidota bacterium]